MEDPLKQKQRLCLLEKMCMMDDNKKEEYKTIFNFDNTNRKAFNAFEDKFYDRMARNLLKQNESIHSATIYEDCLISLIISENEIFKRKVLEILKTKWKKWKELAEKIRNWFN